MKFFKLRWLQRSLALLLAVLLNTGAFGFSDPPCDKKDDFVIHAPQFFGLFVSSQRQNQIQSGVDLACIPAIPLIRKIIWAGCVQGRSFDAVSADLLTYASRAPPTLASVL